MTEGTSEMIEIISKLIDTNSELVSQNRDLVDRLAFQTGKATQSNIDVQELASSVSASVVTALKDLLETNQKITNEVIDNLGNVLTEQIIASSQGVKELIADNTSNLSSEIVNASSECSSAVLTKLTELTVDTTITTDED